MLQGMIFGIFWDSGLFFSVTLVVMEENYPDGKELRSFLKTGHVGPVKAKGGVSAGNWPSIRHGLRSLEQVKFPSQARLRARTGNGDGKVQKGVWFMI